MALPLTRAVSTRFGLVGKQLRDVSQSWLGRLRPPRAAPTPDAAPVPDAPAHAYTHQHHSGEMNHLGHYECDVCAAEMRIAPGGDGPHARWLCPGCGAADGTSFRLCRCGRQAVLDKHAGSARALPVSLNAGGCTECERCVVCGGVLAPGNLMWFHGRWTHLYPDTERDGLTGQLYAVTRERSKFYGFHCHASCHAKDPARVERHRDSQAPEWYARGAAGQRRAEAARHQAESARRRREGRCLSCGDPLDPLSRLLARDRHPRCR